MFIGFIILFLWINQGITITRIPHLLYVNESGLAKNIAFGILALLYWLLLMNGAVRAQKKEALESLDGEEPAEPFPVEEDEY